MLQTPLLRELNLDRIKKTTKKIQNFVISGLKQKDSQIKALMLQPGHKLLKLP
jgi:hypothetical protein